MDYTKPTDARGKPVIVQTAINGDPHDAWVAVVIMAIAVLALGWLIGGQV